MLLMTSDVVYCRRIVSYLGNHHPEIKVTILNSEPFPNDAVRQNTYSVILIGEEFAGVHADIPDNAACAYLSENSAGNPVNGKISVCKYKGGEEIYRTILSLFSEVSTVHGTGGDSAVYSFVGAGGGTGASVAAAALAYKLAATGKKVLFLNLDKFSDKSQLFFDNTCGGNMGDIIFLIKSNENKRINLSVKCASILGRDRSGVNFINSCSNPYNFDEMSFEELTELFKAASSADNFDAVVLDGSIYDSRVWRLISEKSERIFVVSDNGAFSGQKLNRMLDMFRVIDMRGSESITARLGLILNKGASRAELPDGINPICSVPRYADSNPRGIAEAISRLDIWTSVLTR